MTRPKNASDAPLSIAISVPDGRGDVRIAVEIPRRNVSRKHRDVVEEIVRQLARLSAVEQDLRAPASIDDYNEIVVGPSYEYDTPERGSVLLDDYEKADRESRAQ